MAVSANHLIVRIVSPDVPLAAYDDELNKNSIFLAFFERFPQTFSVQHLVKVHRK